MTRHTLATAFTAASLGLFVTGASAQVAMDLANEYPPASIHAQTADTFIAAVDAASAGAITITAHHGAALGYRSADHFDAVGDGAIDLASSFVGAWAGIDPVFLISSLPFLAPSIADNRALYEASKPYYEATLADANQVFLFATPWPPSGLWGKKPLDSMEAIANVRIRTFDANGTITLREAGASPIQLSWADTVPQLTTGGIDGVLTSADGGASAQLWEHQSHFTEVNYAMPLQILHMNKDTFDGLSAEQQQIIRDAAAQAETFGWDLLANRVSENYATMTGAGMTIVTDVSPDYLAALGTAAETTIAEWKARFDAADALMDAYQSARAQ
jgi:TRAP-type C4-dicarboxylate transport system substrate-binding protein